jgi:hypothetical protein
VKTAESGKFVRNVAILMVLSALVKGVEQVGILYFDEYELIYVTYTYGKAFSGLFSVWALWLFSFTNWLVSREIPRLLKLTQTSTTSAGSFFSHQFTENTYSCIYYVGLTLIITLVVLSTALASTFIYQHHQSDNNSMRKYVEFSMVIMASTPLVFSIFLILSFANITKSIIVSN